MPRQQQASVPQAGELPWNSLTSTEEQVLHLLGQGKSYQQVADEVGYRSHTLNDDFMKRVARKLGVPRNEVVFRYVYRLGVRGEPLFLSDETERLYFQQGRVRVAGYPISTAVRQEADVLCPVEPELYEPPVEFRANIEKFREETQQQADTRGEICYEKRPNDLLVVRRLQVPNETYTPVTFVLRRTGYLTKKAISERLTPELKERYRIDPRHVVSAKLPLHVAVSLHVVAGNPPQLVLIRRAPNLGASAGRVGAAVQAYAEAAVDLAGAGLRRRLDYLHAMWREAFEERDLPLDFDEFERRVELLAVTYDFRETGYLIAGYIKLPEMSADSIVEALSIAREGTYEAVPYPTHGNCEDPLEAIARRLINDDWIPGDAISLFVLLEREFGQQPLQRMLRID